MSLNVITANTVLMEKEENTEPILSRIQIFQSTLEINLSWFKLVRSNSTCHSVVQIVMQVVLLYALIYFFILVFKL